MAYPFVESPNVTKTGGRTIDLIVIHTMEMDEKGDTAEHCALWFKNPAAKVSAHYCVDADSIVQCVRDQDIGWHAPGANHDGIGIEHAGRAKQTGRDWSDAYSVAMLERSAGARRRPLHEVLDPGDVALRRRPQGRQARDHDPRRREQGVQARLALGSREGLPRRALPGAGAREHGRRRDRAAVAPAASAAPAALKQSPPLLRLGSHGWHVKRLQRLLRARDLYPEPATIDGDFGEITEAGVKAFQHFADLEQDGIVGPLTWQALAASDVKLPVAESAAKLQPA